MGASNPFWSTPGGASAISAVGSVGSGLFGGLFSFGSQRRQYKYNLRLQKQQQQWQEYMWRMQNEYNLPANEVERLVSAGVNPAVAFSGGGSAAPVPVSGSSGGVSAPTASMPNIGDSAILAAQGAQRLENETKVADSVANKNNAEADAASEQAGLTGSLNEFQKIQNQIADQTQDLIVSNKKLDNLIKQSEQLFADARAKIEGIRADSFREENAFRLSHIRLENDRLRRSLDLVDQQISVLRSTGRLTDQQANLVALRARMVQADLYFAEWNKNMAYEYNRSVFGSGDKVNSGSEAFQNIVSAAEKEYANSVSRALLNEKSLSLDYGFEVGFGASYREYQYEDLRRGANQKRANIWYGGLSALSGAATSAISAGSSAYVRAAAARAFQSTNRSFGYNGVYGSLRYHYGSSEFDGF